MSGWLWAYLCVHSLVVAVVLFALRRELAEHLGLRKPRALSEQEEWASMIDGVHEVSMPQLLDPSAPRPNLLRFGAVMLLVLLLGPLALFFFAIQEWVSSRRQRKSQRAAQPASKGVIEHKGRLRRMQRRHLREAMTVAQIEALEVVADPLGGVSNQPFGHLHGHWQRLRKRQIWGDRFWSFKLRPEDCGGELAGGKGYVLMRWGRPIAHIWTVRLGKNQSL